MKIKYLLVVLLLNGCKNEKVVSLKEENRIHILKNERIEVNLIKAFPYSNQSIDDTLNANLFLCYVDNYVQDTILIFEPCKGKSFEFSNTSPSVIFDTSIIDSKNDYIRIKIPKSKILLENKKYLIANLNHYPDNE